jgi:hypothetical protein
LRGIADSERQAEMEERRPSRLVELVKLSILPFDIA